MHFSRDEYLKIEKLALEKKKKKRVILIHIQVVPERVHNREYSNSIFSTTKLWMENFILYCSCDEYLKIKKLALKTKKRYLSMYRVFQKGYRKYNREYSNSIFTTMKLRMEISYSSF